MYLLYHCTWLRLHFLNNHECNPPHHECNFSQVLDHMEPVERNPLEPFRMPIVDRWKDMGTIVMGKSEAGFVRVGDLLQIMPNK